MGVSVVIFCDRTCDRTRHDRRRWKPAKPSLVLRSRVRRRLPGHGSSNSGWTSDDRATTGRRRRNSLPKFGEQTGGTGEWIFPGSGIAASWREEAYRDAWPARKTHVVGHALHRAEHDARGGAPRGQEADTATSPPWLTPGEPTFRKDADRLPGTQQRDHALEGRGVPGTPPHRNLSEAVENRREPRDPPEAVTPQKAQPAPWPDREPDQNRIPLAVVIGHDEQRSGLRYVLEPLDAKPSPPGSRTKQRRDQAIEHESGGSTPRGMDTFTPCFRCRPAERQGVMAKSAATRRGAVRRMTVFTMPRRIGDSPHSVNMVFGENVLVMR